MVILEGDEEGFYRAVGMLLADPNTMHLREYEAMEGRELQMADILAESIAASRVASYAIRRKAALVCGISRGIDSAMVWMTATAAAADSPAWMLRSMRRILDAGERFIGQGVTLYQAIPAFYPEGVRFVKRLGFRSSCGFVKNGYRFVKVVRET